MTLHETTAKSLLRKHKRIDSWFISHYGFNIYRGCEHDCVYCDGRSERYYVEGVFGREVHVKTNAPELLDKELDPARKRKPLKKGFILPGGGVGDSYQPAEEKYQLTRKVLQVIKKYVFPVHILTKSTLVERDFDLLQDIQQQSKTLMSFSLSSVDEKTASVFEPGLPPPMQRLETLARAKQEGLPAGVFLLPVIPFITDTPEHLYETISAIKEAGADYVVFGGMTLKEGKQKDHFMNVLQKNYPNLITEYEIIYPDNKWGNVHPSYYHALNELFNSLIKQFEIPKRIPAHLFRDYLNINDLVTVILDQIDHLLKAKGQKSPYGYAAYSISQLEEPLGLHRNRLKTLKGVGPVTERIIHEIMNTGTSRYYEKLLIE